jgi:hypothetical protein
VSDYNEIPVIQPTPSVGAVIKHYARKTTKVALIGAAVVGSVVLVQHLRSSDASEDGELTTLTD